MTDERLDRWRDRMVAALYDEVSADERAELEDELERDESLRGEWAELCATRDALRLADDHETDSRDLGLVLPARGLTGSIWRRPAVAGTIGFAAAASVFVALLIAGLRVDHTPAGLLVGFSGSATVEAPAATDAPGVPEVVAQARQPVTREEFAAFADLLVEATAARLDDLEQRQSTNQMQLVGALYDALAVDQRRQYDDLRTRLDAAMLQASLSRAAASPPDRH